MKKSLLLLLFLLISSLALVAVPVRAETVQYYGVRFDGSGYVEVQNLSISDAVTVLILLRDYNVSVNEAYAGGIPFFVYQPSWDSAGNIYYVSLSGHPVKITNKVEVEGRTVLIGGMAVYDVASNTTTEYGVLNGTITYSVSFSGDFTKSSTLRIGADTYGRYGKFTAYAVYVYDRVLSSDELQQIVQNPLNPPTSGLVVFLSPASVDPANSVWKDLSGNGHDGVIYNATPVPLREIPTQVENYGLRFNGASYLFVDFASIDMKQFSFVFILRKETYTAEKLDPLVSWGSTSHGLLIGFDTRWGRHHIYVWMGNGTDSGLWPVIDHNLLGTNENLIAITYDGSTLRAYVNRNLVATVSTSVFAPPQSALYIGEYGAIYLNSTDIYAVYVYSCPISDSEIQKIYLDPYHPPGDCLILWYMPDSYNISNISWLNLAPIYPTLNLSEELDATNYEAIPVNVSIPKVQAYDATNNSEISVYNLTVKTTDGETFIPWFMPLPYNQTLTLNVLAVGYRPSIVSVQAPIDNLVFYLYPSQVITSWERPELNVNLNNITADEYLPDASKDIDKFSSLFTRWLGGEYFKWLLSLDLEGMLKDFFNNPPIPGLGILVALMIWAAAVLMTWIYFEEPEPVFVEGNIVYFGLMQFIDVSPGILAVPLGVFILFLGYKQLYKALKVWAKR